MKAARFSTICFLAFLVLAEKSISSDVLEDWLPQTCQYHGKFQQTRTLDLLPNPLRSSGVFLFDCKAGVIWHTDQPIASSVVYTNQKHHFRISTDNQGKLLKGLVHANMSSMLQALMGGDVSHLTRNFTTQLTSNQGTTGADDLHLLPVNTSIKRHLQEIRLQKKALSMDILLVNNETKRTRISTSEISEFKRSGTEECQELFGIDSLACEALYFPIKLTDAIKAER